MMSSENFRLIQFSHERLGEKNPTIKQKIKEGDGDIICGWCSWNNPKRIGKGTKKFRNKRTSRDHPEYSIIQIVQKTEKSSGDLRDLLSLKLQ